MLMSASKLSFEERVPIVLKIIKEAKEPIGYTELHEKIKSETGVKISKHTLNKCLDFLLFNRQIEKIETKGRGNPIKYSVNHDVFVSKPHERIEAYAYILEHLIDKVDNDSPFGAEAIHYRIIANEMSLLTARLTVRLYQYSKRKDRSQAVEEYKSAIETELVPYMLKMRDLVRPPLTMSTETVALLLTIFCDNVNIFCEKLPHSLQNITEDEAQYLLSLGHSIEMNESPKYIYQKTEVPETLDVSRFGESKYLDMYIEEKEIVSEALKEIRQK